MAFEKINLRKGLMARMERKYLDNGNELTEEPKLDIFQSKNMKGVPLDNGNSNREKVKSLTRFSIGKRLSKRG